MAPVKFHPAAREELEIALEHYGQVDAKLGSDFFAEYIERRTLIAEKPDLFRDRIHGTRRVNLKRFPYYIAYLQIEDVIWIVAVAHARRRPFYWRDRLGDLGSPRT